MSPLDDTVSADHPVTRAPDGVDHPLSADVTDTSQLTLSADQPPSGEPAAADHPLMGDHPVTTDHPVTREPDGVDHPPSVVDQPVSPQTGSSISSPEQSADIGTEDMIATTIPLVRTIDTTPSRTDNTMPTSVVDTVSQLSTSPPTVDVNQNGDSTLPVMGDVKLSPQPVISESTLTTFSSAIMTTSSSTSSSVITTSSQSATSSSVLTTSAVSDKPTEAVSDEVCFVHSLLLFWSVSVRF